MRRLVIVVPELLSEAEPLLDRGLPNFEAIASRSRLFRLSRPEPAETPEARLLGLRPADAVLCQGPLTVSALGADPPSRSLHFHVSLLGTNDDGASDPLPLPTPEEMRVIAEEATRLNTRLLTFVPGPLLDHGLVWEALGELATLPARDLVGKPLRGNLPDGDGDSMLRQYIDDSVNLLSELELNQRRLDEGQSPLNLLWPWGQGIRIPVPNLALGRAAPTSVISNSMRLAGLTRLVGYRHSELRWLGEGLQTRLQSAIGRALTEASVVLVLDAVEEIRGRGELDEAAYFARKLDGELLQPILESAVLEPVKFLLASPSSEGIGLALEFDSRSLFNTNYPFDERSIGEARIPIVDIETIIDSVLSPERSDEASG